MANAMQNARGAAVNQLDRHAADIGRVLGDQANNLGALGEKQRRNGRILRAQLIDVAAARLRDLSTYLQSSSGERIVNDVGDRARASVPVVATLGLLGGFATARILRSRYGHGRG